MRPQESVKNCKGGVPRPVLARRGLTIDGEKGVTTLKTALFAALAVALTTALSLPAFARENPADFPMPAGQFEQRVEARLERAKGRLESDIAARGLSDAQAREARARFDTVAARVEAETKKVAASGTVSLAGAREVRRLARELRGHPRRESRAHGQGSDA